MENPAFRRDQSRFHILTNFPSKFSNTLEAHSQELFDLESKGLIVGQEKLLRAELERLTEKIEKLRDMMDMGRCCATCKHDTRSFCPPSCVNDNYRYWEMEEV